MLEKGFRLLDANEVIKLYNKFQTIKEPIDVIDELEINEITYEDMSFYRLEHYSNGEDSIHRDGVEQMLFSIDTKEYNFVYVISGSREGVEVAFGIVKNENYKDNKESDYEISDYAYNIAKLYEGSMPSAELKKMKLDDVEIMLEKSEKYKHVGMIQGIPSSRYEDYEKNKKCSRGCRTDRIIKTMNDSEWRIIIVCEKVDEEEVIRIREEVCEIYNSLELYKKQAINKMNVSSEAQLSYMYADKLMEKFKKDIIPKMDKILLEGCFNTSVYYMAKDKIDASRLKSCLINMYGEKEDVYSRLIGKDIKVSNDEKVKLIKSFQGMYEIKNYMTLDEISAIAGIPEIKIDKIKEYIVNLDNLKTEMQLKKDNEMYNGGGKSETNKEIHNVIITISDNELAAMDVKTTNINNVTDICILGEKICRYNLREDIEQFVSDIKSYYKIDDFDETSIISIFNFNANKNNINILYDLLKSSKICNVIEIEKYLPIIMLKEGMVEANSENTVKIFNTYYDVKIDENFVIECSVSNSDSADILLSNSILGYYYCFDAKNIIENNNYIDVKQKEIEKREEEIKEYIEVVEKLKHEIKNKEKQYIEEQNRAIYLEKRLKILEHEYDESLLNKKRAMCRFSEESNIANSPVPVYYKINYHVTDGEIVEKDQVIATIRMTVTSNIIEKSANIRATQSSIMAFLGLGEEIKAKSSGRIYNLYNADDKVKVGDVVAIIGDMSDTKDDVMVWYSKNK